MMLGLVWMTVANAAVLIAARVAVRRCGTGTPAVDLVLFLLFRFAFIMALVISTGLAGLLTPLGLGLTCAVLLAALLARGERLDAPWNLDLPREIPRLGVVFLVLFAARALFQALTYAPINGDAASYHLPKVAEWARSGRLLIDLGNDPRAWFPAGFELVEAWWVIFLHHDVLIELAGLEFLTLAGAATWALAGWLGVGRFGSMIASLAAVSIPGLAAQAISCLNDGPAAALFLAGAVLVAHRVPLPLLVFVGGLAAGLKPTTAYALPGLLLLMGLVRNDPPARTVPRGWAWGAAALGLAIGSFWYLRTWIFTGNPLYPVGSADILSAKGQEMQRLGPSLSVLVQNLSDLANQRIYDARRPYHALLDHSAGWGPAIVACGLPGLVWALRDSSRFRKLGAAFAASLVAVLSLVVYDNYNLRFILWFPALPALGLAWSVERRRWLSIPASLTLALTLLGTTFYGNYTFSLVNTHLRQETWTDGAMWTHGLSPEPRVGTYGRYNSQSYFFYGPDFRNEVIPLRAARAEDLRSELHRHRLRLLYAFKVHDKSPEGLVLAEAVRRGWLSRIKPAVYRVKP